VLELGEGKLSRPVLRGPGGRKAAWLLGSDLRAWDGVWTDYRQSGRLSIALLCGTQIRMVLGFTEIIEREESLVAEACNHPNFLSCHSAQN
jgi:hypothetical protein